MALRGPLLALSRRAAAIKAMSDLGATADIGRRDGLDGSVAFDPKQSLRRTAFPGYSSM
jgi:hypothetical protein